MREAASRGFWVASRTPYGYNRVMVQDGPKKRPTLEPDPTTTPILKRIFDMAEAGRGMTDITRTLNDEGIASPAGKLWGKTSVHAVLKNEVYTGALVWGAKAKDNAEPVRVDKAFPGIISKAQFRRVNKLDALPRTQGQPPPKGGKLLPAQRTGQVQDLQQGALRPGLQERPVLLLRLPVDHEARQRRLRFPQAQRPELRGAGRGEDSLQHPHREQHPRPGEGGGRGDGWRGQRAAQEA